MSCHTLTFPFTRHVTNVTYVLFLLLFTSCSPTPQPEQVVVNAYATSAAMPWLADLYACAEKANVVINISAESPEIYLRVGEPAVMASSAYQIGEEEILIATHRESPVQNLTLAQAQDLFAQGNNSAQVWVYPSDADMQRVFDQLVMQGRSVSSSAKIAASPQNMSDVLSSESNAVGILPRHWKAGNVREVYSAGTVPVLAVTKSEPQGIIIDLISCVQNK
jgi:hypothetical protein